MLLKLMQPGNQRGDFLSFVSLETRINVQVKGENWVSILSPKEEFYSRH